MALPHVLKLLSRLRLFIRSMKAVEVNGSILDPPEAVRGMTKWNPELFKKTIKVPVVILPAKNVGDKRAGKILKKAKLMLSNLQPIKEVDERKKCVFLNPNLVEELTKEDREKVENEFEGVFQEEEITLNHRNYSPSNALKAIFPPDVEGLTSNSIIGHITYVNLHDHLLPYKEVIGQVLLDASTRTKLVVTKTNTIENKFRNLDLEILAGDPDLGFEVIVKENGCSFKLDFSEVYWNPRLSTEHWRIVELVQRGDIVFDVMAGIGPFSVPIGKKGQVSKKNPIGITVYANDLNPSSFRYLKENAKLNKLQESNFHTFNLDGGEFIRQKFPQVLQKYYEEKSNGRVHVLMNLPAIAITFLPNFCNLLTADQVSKWGSTGKPCPIVHVYTFKREEDDLSLECARQLQVNEGCSIPDLEINFVRDVAPKKLMYRVSIPLTLEMMRKDRMIVKDDNDDDSLKKEEEPDLKRQKMQE